MGAIICHGAGRYHLTEPTVPVKLAETVGSDKGMSWPTNDGAEPPPGSTGASPTRKSGLPRQTPVGGRIDGGCFWMVSDHGHHSQYVRNIEADPRVRVRVGRRSHTGIAHPMPEDDPRRRLKRLPRANGLLVRLLGTDLLTIRIDLRTEESAPYGR
jgi:deazaflavin-dependent oxidoreductase (nitroreductase family)